MAVGFPTKANWAAGDVLTASQMDDLAGTVNLLQNSAFPIMAGKNFVINGGMDWWQRGTSSTAFGYLADRWFNNFSSGTGTYAQESTVVPTGSQYALKFTASSTAQPYHIQGVETLNTLPLVNKTVTLSAQVAASTSVPMQMLLQYSTSVDAAINGAFTTIGSVATATPTSTTYVPISGTFTIPSSAKTLRVFFQPASTIANGVIYYIGQVQLELGSTATTFSRAGGSIGGELALCQRYYWRNTVNAAYGSLSLVNGASSTTTVYAPVQFPVTMRIAPTSLEYPTSYTGVSVGDGTNRTAVTALALDSASINSTNVQATVASGLTQYRPSYIQANNSATAFLGFSAEL